MSEATAPALSEKILFEGTIEALTGLHIGGNDTGLSIGGADKIVVRNPADDTPYVPGSSLRGKMRSLLEKATCANESCEGFRVESGELKRPPCDCGKCPVCEVFGVAADRSGKSVSGAGRLMVRDAHLLNAEELRAFPGAEMPFTEVKTEVSIDRLTSQANPRQFERVPAGARFRFAMVLNVFQGDDAERMIRLIQQGLGLVGDDSLGGQGSRGYGQVRIVLERIARVPVSAYADPAKLLEARQANSLSGPIHFGQDSPREATTAK